jgi:biotin transport system substrate-specific component
MKMMTSSLSVPTLAESVWPLGEKTAAQRFVRGALLAFSGSLLIAISSKIQVPFYPVPLNMATFVILTLAMAYGPRLGMATILLYMAEGAAGLPVFAGTPEKGIGLAYMAGPTGGYLLGYVLAVGICSWAATRGWDRHVGKTALTMLAANVAIYVAGLLWLGTLLGWDKPILEWGLYPFVLGDLTKLALASVSLSLIWRTLKRQK